jgi:hypothetical protein
VGGTKAIWQYDPAYWLTNYEEMQNEIAGLSGQPNQAEFGDGEMGDDNGYDAQDFGEYNDD